MAANLTKPTTVTVASYIATLADPIKLADANQLLTIMQRLTGASPRMWGPTIIGFGEYHYKYASGREGDFFLAGFAPRKAHLIIYLNGTIPQQSELLAKLGKHKMGKGCLYIKRLTNLDLDVLETLIKASIAALRQTYPDTNIPQK